MNRSTLLAALALALIVAGGLVWWSGSREPRQERGAARPAAPSDAPPAAPGAAGVEAPPAAAPGASSPEAPRDVEARTAEPAPAAPAVEPVVPLLELNAAAAGAIAGDTAESQGGTIDELLGGKHAGKSKAQLQASLKAVQAVLFEQQDPSLPKERILAPEAIQALSIEAAWLKERTY